MSNEQLATRQPTSVKDYLALAAYKDRFQEVLGKRANQFMAAITASSNLPGLKDAEPRSIIAAAMVAATLDLPINPTLGMAHIVAYGDGQGNKVAQFQCGYKGFIQLALRSGQYKRLNAGPVSGSVFKGYDIVGEPVLNWSDFDPSAEVTGYFCAFETLNGFTKVVYWTKAQCEAHAKRFSKAYAKGYSTPWKSDFDSMATKTVIKAALTKWGIMSVEMQRVATHDQGAQDDIDSEVKFVDGEDKTVDDGVPGDPKPERPAPPERKTRGAKAVAAAEVVVEKEVAQQAAPAPEVAAAAPSPTPAEAPAQTPAMPKLTLKDGEKLAGIITVADSGGFIWGTSPATKAITEGDYKGTVYCKNAGTVVDGKVVIPALWAPGSRLKVSLVGSLNMKARHPATKDAAGNKVQGALIEGGVLQTLVESAEAVAADGAEEME